MVCDYCVNQEEYDKKMAALEKQKQEDMDFAREVNKRLQEEINEEQRKLEEKKKLYQDTLDQQRKDMELKK